MHDTPKDEALLIYDCSTEPATTAPIKCVTIGYEKHSSDTRTAKHYVLIVRATSNKPQETSYERVGVGYLLGKFINRDEVSVMVD